MPRTCDECGSTWDARASFCGRCGGLLDDDLARRGDPGGGARARWRRPWVGALGVVVVLAGAVAAVPRLSIEPTPAVDGEIGVPETEDLNAAPASARQRPAPAPPPELACTVDGEPTDCVAWSRQLLAPEDPTDGYAGWAAPMGGHVVVTDQSAVAVVDAETGTRLWRDESLAGAYPVATLDDGLVLDDEHGLRMRELADGQERWTAPSDWGNAVASGDLLVTGATPDTVQGLDPSDGRVVWEASLPWPGNVLQALPRHRVIVEEVATPGNRGGGDPIRFAVLDATTGSVTATFEGVADGWIELLDDHALAVVPDRPAPEAPNLAGDGGGTVTAIDLHTGRQLWTAEVPSTGAGVGVLADLLVVPSTNLLVGRDLVTGTPRWELPLTERWGLASHASSRWAAAPTEADLRPPAVVVHTPDGLVRGLDPGTGETRWEHRLGHPLGHVVATHEHVFAMGATGLLTILDPTTGRERLRLSQGTTSLAHLTPALLVDHLSGHVIRIVASGVEVS